MLYIVDVRRDNITLEIEELSQLWIGWIGYALHLLIDWLWVQPLLRTKLIFLFGKFFVAWYWRDVETLAA